MSNQDKSKEQLIAELDQLRTSEERLDLALEAAGIAVWEWNVLSDKITWSKGIEQIFGLKPGEFEGSYEAFVTPIHPDDRAAVDDTVSRIFASLAPDYCLEYRVLWPDGSIHWVEAKGRVYRDPLGRPVQVTGIIADITPRKQAEIALQEEEERYRNISELVSDYAYSFRLEPDGQAVLEWVTDAFTRITGYTPAEMGQPDQRMEIIYPEDRAIALQHQQRLQAGQPGMAEFRLFTKAGRLIWLRQYNRPVWDETQGRVVRIYGAAKDITQLKQMEQKLGQAQKLEAIGRLAGGIAHDFNNILTVILGNASLMLDDLSQEHPLHYDIEQIQKAAERAAALTRQLLAFSRQQILQPKLINLNEVVAGVQKLIRRLIGEDIELVLKLNPALGWVRADQGQLEQVMMNLAINARDAMPHGGKLFIETGAVALDELYTSEQDKLAPGTYTMLAISDTGVGMDVETRSRIFEPFFTTKEIGHGTGLGLATVHGIVSQSGGHIWVYSEPGYGATFKIYLPRVEAMAEPVEVAPAPPPLPPDTGTILLVEDETPMREIAGRVLRGRGYRVLEAANGAAAVQLAAHFREPIDLLLTDVIMPGGLNGRQLADLLRLERPELKVLYMSGYTDNIILHHGIMPDLIFLQKPFTPAVLAYKVWEALHQP